MLRVSQTRISYTRLFAIIGLAAAFFRLGVGTAYSHDIYFGLRSGFDSAGQQTFLRDVGNLCCGGDPVTGDCEALDDFRGLPNGNFMIHSRRYNRDVEIAASRVAWTGIPGDNLPVHWCGKPRDQMAYGYGSSAPADPEQPDTSTWTYCAFIVPGGM